MARKKHREEDKADPRSSFLGRLIRSLQGTLGQAALAVGFFLLVGLLSFYLWGRFRERILTGGNYIVAAEDILIPDLPPWICTDLKSEAITSGSLENMNVQQKDLQRRVAAAFEMHPWVSEVRRVTARYPAKVIVDLAYRRPIAMVQVSIWSDEKQSEELGLYPVDPEGTLLPPHDFTPEEATNFPRIVAEKAIPNGAPGFAWGDGRVHGGAKIAQHLEKVWNRLQLTSITAHPDHRGISAPSTLYEIKTTTRTSIVWGHGPGEEEAGEPRAESKVQRLLDFVNQNGSLTVKPDEVIDLRQSDQLSVAKREDLDVTLQ